MKILITFVTIILSLSLASGEPLEIKPTAKTETPSKEEAKKPDVAEVKPTPPSNEIKKVESQKGRTVVIPNQSSRSTVRPRVSRSSSAVQPSRTRSQPSVRRPNPQQGQAVPVGSNGLTENVTISLKGKISGASDLDLSLTGIGPLFQADTVFGEENTILSHQYSVKPQNGGYKVEYSVGLRLKMEVGKSGQSVNYEFRDVSITGTALVKEGKKVVISKNGDQELSLTIGKAEEE